MEKSVKIIGISHPIPTEYAKRIYDEGKTVFVSRSYLGKVSKGAKFIIYESYGEKAYTGWADIISIGKVKKNQILRKYKSKLMITSEELEVYSKNKDMMTVIEFENFEKFKTPVKPDRFVTVAGKYINEEEYDMIKSKKG